MGANFLQHFQMHFVEWKKNISIKSSPKLSQVFSWQYSSIDLDNVLVLTKWQVIIWNNDG